MLKRDALEILGLKEREREKERKREKRGVGTLQRFSLTGAIVRWFPTVNGIPPHLRLHSFAYFHT